MKVYIKACICNENYFIYDYRIMDEKEWKEVKNKFKEKQKVKICLNKNNPNFELNYNKFIGGTEEIIISEGENAMLSSYGLDNFCDYNLIDEIMKALNIEG